MLEKLARLGVLVAAAVVSLASASRQGSAPRPYAGRPGTDAYSCALLVGATTRGTLCVPTYERCERERRAAEQDGAQTHACAPQAPVSCFQIGGDPNPSMEMCGATAEDCDLWRLIDQDRNGRTAGPCEWRHGDLGAPQPR